MSKKDRYGRALRILLIRDAYPVLDLINWVNDDWLRLPLSRFYRDGIVAQNAVVFIVRRILAHEGRSLSSKSEKNLRKRISLSTSGNDAINLMISTDDANLSKIS